MELIVKPEIRLWIDREVDDSEATQETVDALRHWLEERFEGWMKTLLPGDYEITLRENRVGCVRPEALSVDEILAELGPEDQARLEQVLAWERIEDEKRRLENLAV